MDDERLVSDPFGCIGIQRGRVWHISPPAGRELSTPAKNSQNFVACVYPPILRVTAYQNNFDVSKYEK